MLHLLCMISFSLIFDSDYNSHSLDLKLKATDVAVKSDVSHHLKNISRRNKKFTRTPLKPDGHSPITRNPYKVKNILQLQHLKNPRIKSILRQDDEDWQLQRKVLNFYNSKDSINNLEMRILDVPPKYIKSSENRNGYRRGVHGFDSFLSVTNEATNNNNTMLSLLTESPNILKKEFVSYESVDISGEHLFNWKEVSIIASAAILLTLSVVSCVSLTSSTICKKKPRMRSEFEVDKWLANQSNSGYTFNFPKNGIQVSDENMSCSWSHNMQQKKNEEVVCQCSSANSSTSIP